MKAKYIVGIDVGGTKIRVGLVSPSGKIISSLRVPTEAKKGPAVVLKNVIDATSKVWQKNVAGIGVGMAGLVDYKKGVFLGGPNLPKELIKAKISDILKKRFKVPVKVDNDVHCFTLAEALVGAGKGKNSVFGITFGTGIGGGLVVNGRLLRGRNNAAGEIGHAVIGLGSKFKCSCGRKGHFEAFASGKAMSNIYKSLSGHVVEPKDVERLAKKGDRHAKETLRIMADGIVAGITTVIDLLNPDIIVVGGGLSAVKSLWGPVLKRLHKDISFAELRNTPVVQSKLGTDANIIGAALLFSERN